MHDKKQIAVIGSGIAGLASAWLLSKQYQVTLYEKNDYIGGHTNTRPAQFGEKEVHVDTGFMVFNHQTYPNLVKMFEHLGVETVETDMSFGVSLNRGKFEFSSDKVCVQKRNWLQPSFWKMLFDIVRFNQQAATFAEKHQDEYSLRELLQELNLSKRYSEQYLLPMAGAIWSTGKENILDYPAKQFISFCENHGLLTPKTLNPFRVSQGRLQWYTVKNGAQNYVKKILADMKAEVLLGTGVSSVVRSKEMVIVIDKKGGEREFDMVVCASHPDQTLRILSDASDEEKDLLGAFMYTKNHTVMHKDTSCMMKNTNKWPSWTYTEQKGKRTELSYYMNKLQHVDPSQPVIVTLNPTSEIDKKDIFFETDYEHPLFSVETKRAQDSISLTKGKQNTYFVGAWLGHGFHEDGLRSALEVAKELGIQRPWTE